MDPIKAVYDANVLYSAPLRDLFIRLAQADLVQARWTELIHDEWIRNVVRDYAAINREKADRIRDLMHTAIPSALVTGYESLIDTLVLPDPDDRHVLAAAIHAKAQVTVTFNLKDFPASALTPHQIEAVHPDDLVLSLLDASPDQVCSTIKQQRESLRNPPITAEEMLKTLERQQLVKTVSCLRPLVEYL
jgi:predicted nucleic acid-binding protein